MILTFKFIKIIIIVSRHPCPDAHGRSDTVGPLYSM